MNASGTLIHPL